jgi:hypothetical protein
VIIDNTKAPNDAKPLLAEGFFDSLGNELKEGDVFEYTSKKWKSRARIINKNGILCTMVTERDMPDKFVPLEKYLKRHYVVKVG